MKKLATLLSLTAGLIFFVWLLKSIDLKPLEGILRQSGIEVIAIGLFFGFAQLSYCAAWAFPLRPIRIPFARLFCVYLGGDVANYAFQLAGEPLRANLLRPHYSLTHGFYSVTVGKYCELLAQAILYCIGFLTFLFILPVSPITQTAVAAGFGSFIAVIAFLFWRQHRGLYSPLFALWEKVTRRPLPEKTRGKILGMDKMISRFYREDPGGFFMCVFLKFVGKWGGVAEVAFVLFLLGHHPSLSEIIAIETLVLLSNDFLFFVPGRVGGAEGIRVLIFLLFGYPASEGLVYAIIRRIREVLWVGVGLLALVFLRFRSSEPAHRSPSAIKPLSLPKEAVH